MNASIYFNEEVRENYFKRSDTVMAESCNKSVGANLQRNKAILLRSLSPFESLLPRPLISLRPSQTHTQLNYGGQQHGRSNQ